jgi:hypothetical protein
MLKSGVEMELLTSLAAPRFQKVLIGDSDPLSPISGVHTVVDFTRQIYSLYDARNQFEAVIYEGVGHTFTIEMFSEMLKTLRTHLQLENR